MKFKNGDYVRAKFSDRINHLGIVIKTNYQDNKYVLVKILENIGNINEKFPFTADEVRLATKEEIDKILKLLVFK